VAKQLAYVTGRLPITTIACSVLAITWILAAAALFLAL